MNGMERCCPAAIEGPVTLQRGNGSAGAVGGLGNGLRPRELAPPGGERAWRLPDALLPPSLPSPARMAPLAGCAGEFWDAWHLAGDIPRSPPAPELQGRAFQVAETGPLAADWSGAASAQQCPAAWESAVAAGSPWLELTLRVDCASSHELCGSSCPCSSRLALGGGHLSWRCWSGPCPGLHAAAEASRWEVPAISAVASRPRTMELAVLARCPRGPLSRPRAAGAGVSLLRQAPAGLDPRCPIQGVWQPLGLPSCPCPPWLAPRAAVAGRGRCRSGSLFWLRASPAGMCGRAAGGGRIPYLGSERLQLCGLRPDSGAGVLQLTARPLALCARPWRSAGGAANWGA